MTKQIASPAFRRALAAGLVLILAAPAGASDHALPSKAKPLNASQLLQLFGGKTWKWGEGGGYFALDGRAFHARTFGDKGETTARGKWRITDTGLLCFRAKWKIPGGTYPADTCFEHMLARGDVYQRKLPDGDWYVFRHAKPDPADEYNKLVGEDLVTTAGGKKNGGA